MIVLYLEKEERLLIDPVSYQGTVLIVDDDSEIRDVLKVLLSSENFQVIEASSGEMALELMSPQIDLVILDVMMPGMSGYDLCRTIRSKHNAPILFLTAKTGNSDLVMGYASGGDDYLSKPFSYPELVARVKGLLRRYTVYQGRSMARQKSEYLEHGSIRLDCTRNQVWKHHEPIDMTDTEYRILKLLMTYPGQFFSPQNIYETVWDEPYLPSSNNTVMVFIRKIREKIEDDPRHPVFLTTVWGKGYQVV